MIDHTYRVVDLTQSLIDRCLGVSVELESDVEQVSPGDGLFVSGLPSEEEKLVFILLLIVLYQKTLEVMHRYWQAEV